MKRSFVFLVMMMPFLCIAQKAKTDTVQGVVVYTSHSDLILSRGNYHTYTVEATEVIADTGVVSIHTELGYLDLKKNYQFIPMNKLQPSRLKKKP
jgi:hypothetical protein